MLRKLIKIDKEKCNGCGACADACHEGAIDIIDGKAELMREHFCDGSSGCSPDSKNPGADRALKEQPEGSSFQTWSAADGRSETWSAGLSEEE